MKKLSVALLSLGLVLMFQGSVTINAQSTPNYVLAKDSDFSGESNGDFRYIGTDEYVEIPHVIKGVPVTSYRNMFEGTSVKGVKSTNTNVTDMSYMFYNSQATELDLSNFDTGKVTNMSRMFYGAGGLTELNLSSFDTSNVTDMGSMFESVSSLTELDLSNFDTSNVTNMGYMFVGTSSLTELDLSNFDTSNVTSMRYMFSGASSLTELDLSSFDTSNVTDMSFMFSYARSLTELDLSSFDTSNVTNMSFMFRYTSSLTGLDLSSFDTSNVTNMTYMFQNTKATKGYARTQADADRFNTSSGKPRGLTFVVKGTPVVTFSENGNSTYQKSHSTTVNVDVVDVLGESLGESLTSLQYAWSTSAATPTSGWKNFMNGQTITHSSGTGDYYLHVRATSKLGITTTETTNVFKFDNTPPTINVTPNKTEQTHENITLTVTATDSHSGIKRIKLPNGEWINDTTATYVAKSNGEYEFIAEDNAGNTTTETILVNNIVGTISMEQPVISSFSEINLKDTTEIVSTNIEPVIISDWRDGTNEWKLSVSASRLQLTDDSFILPKGSIRIAGLDKIDKVEGDGILPTKSFSSIMPIDDGQVEIAKGAQSKGKFELIFPNNALEIVIDPYVTKKGTYYSTITWELVNAP